MPEVWFGSDVYLWAQHESVLATLWRTMVRANWPLWVVEHCVVSLSASPPTVNKFGSYQATVAPSLVGPVGIRERKHLRSKKYTKNRLALLRITTATQ